MPVFMIERQFAEQLELTAEEAAQVNVITEVAGTVQPDATLSAVT